MGNGWSSVTIAGIFGTGMRSAIAGSGGRRRRWYRLITIRRRMRAGMKVNKKDFLLRLGVYVVWSRVRPPFFNAWD